MIETASLVSGSAHTYRSLIRRKRKSQLDLYEVLGSAEARWLKNQSSRPGNMNFLPGEISPCAQALQTRFAQGATVERMISRLGRRSPRHASVQARTVDPTRPNATTDLGQPAVMLCRPPATTPCASVAPRAKIVNVSTRSANGV